MKVMIKCPECGKILNETKPLSSEEEADKLYKDALVNPLIGWCRECDIKGTPEIVS